MAEPGDSGFVSMRVTRESSVSRLEKQLLVKVYDIVIPVVQGACHLSPHSAERMRSSLLTGSTSHTKGV
jgi:hypothetical protein